jgi:ATP-dependent DNA helicase PIF1
VGTPKILKSISATNPTLNNVGVYLLSPVFYHGQLYVVISWVINSANMKIFRRVMSSANIKIFSGQNLDGYMRNVVYREVLEL